MKKSLILALIFIGVLFIAVSYSDIHYSTAIGNEAPALRLAQGSNIVSLNDMRGKYVLLNFWKSTDATSRRDANIYTAWSRSHPGAAMDLVNVNFDSNPELFSEIVRRDGLNPSQQFRVGGDTAVAVSRTFGLESGYGSLLINPEGKIIAHNPSESQLSALVR